LKNRNGKKGKKGRRRKIDVFFIFRKKKGRVQSSRLQKRAGKLPGKGKEEWKREIFVRY